MPHPLLNTCTSSNVAAYWTGVVGDEPNGYGTVLVEFLSGSIYRYTAPLGKCLEMKIATSKGQFVNELKKIAASTAILSVDAVTALISKVPSNIAKPKKPRKKRLFNMDSFFAKHPELSAFF